MKRKEVWISLTHVSIPESIPLASAWGGWVSGKTCWTLGPVAWLNGTLLCQSTASGLWHWRYRKYWHTWELGGEREKEKKQGEPKKLKDLVKAFRAKACCDMLWGFKVVNYCFFTPCLLYCRMQLKASCAKWAGPSRNDISRPYLHKYWKC